MKDFLRFLRYLTFSIVAGLTAGPWAAPVAAQNLPAPNANIPEEQDYAFANGLYKDGLFQLAADQLAKFVNKYPRSIRLQDAAFLRADCLLQLSQYPAAVREFSGFIKDYPASNLVDNAHFRLGDAFLKLKRTRDAIDAYKAVLEHPKNAPLAGEAAYWIGEAYFKDGDNENALKYYTLSYEAYPGNRLQDYAAYSAAWASEKKGDYAKAAEWYRMIVDKIPTSTLVPSARLKVGECYYSIKDYPRAIQELKAAEAKIDSTDLRGEADYLIGEAYFNQGQLDDAEKQYEGFLKTYPNHRLSHEVQYALGWTLFKERKFVSSAAVFAKIADTSDPLGQAAQFRKGISEKAAGRRDAARVAFASLIAQRPMGEYADNALYEEGTMLFEDKRTEDAKRDFDRIIAEFPSSDVLADSYRMLGECFLIDAAYDSARVSYDKALTFSEASFDTKVNSAYQSAWCSFKLNKYKDAAAGFTKFVTAYRDHPKSADALYWLAESEYQGGDYRSALKHYQEIAAVAGQPHREEGIYGIGWSYYKLGDFPKAISAFEQVILAFPSGKFSFDARLRLGDCYFQQKDYKKAAGAYRAVVRLFPKQDGADYAVYQLGQTYYRSGDQDQASDQFTYLLKTYPSSSLADKAQYALGWMKFQKKEYAEAIAGFRATIAAYPNSDLAPRSYYSIGDAYYNLRKYPEAENAYREVIQRFPKSPLATDALNGVQYCLVAQGKPKEAVGVIESYVKSNPSSPNTEQLEIKKAELLFSQKQYTDAAREYRSFAVKHPQSTLRAQALYWSGKSMQEAGNIPEAVKAYQDAADAALTDVKIKGNALLDCARIYLQQKDYAQAFGVLDRAEKDLAGSEFEPQVAYAKGVLYLENGSLDDARVKFDFVVSKYPSSLEADESRVGLVRVALREKDFSAAQNLAQKVSTTRTDEIGAEAQYLSGVTYAETKDWQNAITAFLRVRYVFPSHERWLAKAYIGLGNAYEQSKDPAKARESYLQVLKIYKTGVDFDEATSRLKALGEQ